MSKSHALTVLPPFNLPLRLTKHLLAVFGLHHVQCVFITFRQFFRPPNIVFALFLTHRLLFLPWNVLLAFLSFLQLSPLLSFLPSRGHAKT